jgi:hypothetical protein
VPSIGTNPSRGTSPRPDSADPAGQEAAGAGLIVPCQALLALSDERDAWLRRLLAAYREGYAHGREDGYQAGYVTGILARKHADRDVYEGLQLEARRWELRGEQRTRATFGLPHPDDYPGKDAA